MIVFKTCDCVLNLSKQSDNSIFGRRKKCKNVSWNSKNPDQTFSRTKRSELQNLKKEKDKYPVKVYGEKLGEAMVNNVADDRQRVDFVRGLKQVQNTLHRKMMKSRLGDDDIYHLIELKEETDFIRNIVISPYPIVTCFSQGKNCNSRGKDSQKRSLGQSQ